MGRNHETRRREASQMLRLGVGLGVGTERGEGREVLTVQAKMFEVLLGVRSC